MAPKLVTLHKIMVSASILVSLLFASWAGWMYGQQGAASQLVLAIVAVGIAVALAAYLKYFIRRRLK